MTRAGPVELEDELSRLAAESLAARTILARLLARLSAVRDPNVSTAVAQALDDCERMLKAQSTIDAEALTPAGFAMALSAFENVKAAAGGDLGKARAVGTGEAPGAFHAESNDRWPEDDY